MKLYNMVLDLIGWVIGRSICTLIISPFAYIAWRKISWDFNLSPLNFITIFLVILTIMLIVPCKESK